MFIDDIEKQFDAYKENGAIRGDVDLDKAIDTSITEKAVETIGKYERNDGMRVQSLFGGYNRGMSI